MYLAIDTDPLDNNQLYRDAFEPADEILSFIFAKLSVKKQECNILAEQNVELSKQIKDHVTDIGNLRDNLKNMTSR